MNKALPAAQRIHVWLGKPPVDWPTATRAQVLAAFGARDSSPAGIIDREILAKRRKALVIYGSFHFGAGRNWLRGQIESKYPSSVYAILGGLGVEQNRPGVCAPLQGQLAKVWPGPAMVSAVPGAPVDAIVLDCLTLKPQTASAGAFVRGPGPRPLPVRPRPVRARRRRPCWRWARQWCACPCACAAPSTAAGRRCTTEASIVVRTQS